MTSSDKPRVLHIDLETYSSVDLAACGAYKYAESDDFRILLLGYAYDDEAVSVLQMPSLDDLQATGLLHSLTDSHVIKVAHNAAFERTCLSRFLNLKEGEIPSFLPPEQWHDTMIMALEHGYPASLAQLGAALGLPEDKQKMAEGKRLIEWFCKPLHTSSGLRRHYPEDDLLRWDTFVEYNRRDVESEREIYNRLMAMGGVTPEEWHNWCVDQRINDRGIRIDMQLVRNVLGYGEDHSAALIDEAKRITGLENPMSLLQLKSWIRSADPEHAPEDDQSLDKAAVNDMLKEDLKPETRRVLEIRQELGKTSVRKYDAFARSASSMDDRVRGCFQFYGGRTGRFAGRLIQPQNFPRNSFDDIDEARGYVRTGDWAAMETMYDSPNDVFATLIRTAIIPSEGFEFVIADYSAIEARVTAWLAREEWRQKAFAAGEDIYCASASQMFGVPVVKHGVNGHLRQKGKIAELALGYGGGVGALTAMGGAAMGLTEAEMNDIVQKWRRSSPRIVKLWKTLDTAVRKAINGSPVSMDRNMQAYTQNGILYIVLPNGRRIAYVNPRISEQNEIIYQGQNQVTRKWEPVKTWGGKLTENVIQAIARDCLCGTLATLEHRGFRPVMHVHDEVICEVPTELADSRLEKLKAIMRTSPAWAPDLILNCDGFSSQYYRKD